MILDINLLQKRKHSKNLDQFIAMFRSATILFGGITIISLVVLFLLINNVQKSLESRRARYDSIMSTIAQSQQQETAALLLHKKYIEINNILSKEPNYLQQFDTIMGDLPQASSSGALTSLAIIRGGKVTAKLTFNDILSFSKFLTYIESDEFKERYATVKSSQISFSGTNPELLTFTLDVTF